MKYKGDSIFILDKRDEVIGVLSNNMPSSTPYWDDEHHEILENGYETFEFKTVISHPTGVPAQISEENKILIRDFDGISHVFRIRKITDNTVTKEKLVFAETEAVELLNDPVRPITISGSPSILLGAILQPSRWQPGIVETAAINTLKVEEYSSVLAQLHVTADLFNLEIRFRIEFTNNRVTGRYVDLLQRRGNPRGGFFEYSQDIKGLTRTKDTTELATALIGVGRSDQNENTTTFKNVVWNTFSGHPVDKPGGQDFVGDPGALQQFGVDGRHIFRVYTSDQSDPSLLLQETWDELQRRIKGAVDYEVDLVVLERIAGYEHKAVRIGDTITVKDTSFTTPLVLEARVLEIKRSRSNPANDAVILGEYREREVKEIELIRQLQSELAKNAAKWNNGFEVYEQDFPPSNPYHNMYWLDTSKEPNIWMRYSGDTNRWIPGTPSDASQIDYLDGLPLEHYKPAQPGADVTGDNVSHDTGHVGGLPSETVKDNVNKIIYEVGNGTFETVDGALLKAGPISPSPPFNPQPGQKWIDISNPDMEVWKRWDGTAKAWVEIGRVSFDQMTGLVKGNQIGLGAVGEQQLADLAVTLKKLANDSVDVSKIVDAAISEAKIQTDAITNVKIANNAVDINKIVDNAISSAKIQSSAVTDAKIAANAVTTTKILDNAIAAAKIAANAVTEAKINTGAVTTTKILDGAIANAKIAADAVTDVKIATGAVTTTKLVDDAIIATKIAANAVTNVKIATDAVTDVKIAANAVTTTKILDSAIATAKIAANAITTAKIGTGQVTATQILDRTISRVDVALAGIQGENVADRTIAAGKIIANTITGGEIAANTITAAQIAALTITANEIGAEAITAEKIRSKAITADKIAANAIQVGGPQTTFAPGYNPTENGVEMFDQRWKSNADILPLSKNGSGNLEIVPPTDLGLATLTNVLKFTNSSFYRSDFIPYAPGVPVHVYVKAMNAETSNGIFYVGLEFYGPDKVELGPNGATIYGISSSILVADEWTEIRGTITPTNEMVQSKAAYVRVRILTRWSNLTGITYISDLNFRQVGANIAAPLLDQVTLWRHQDTTYIDGGQIFTDSVTANQIAAGAITASEVAANAITSEKVLANAITAEKIATDTITANEIAANAITTSEIAANAVTAVQIAAGTITANEISTGAITADKIAAGAIVIGSDRTQFADGYDPTKKQYASTLAEFYNVMGVNYHTTVTADLLINTNISMTSRMYEMDFKGYNYLTNESVIDFSVGFYAYGSPAFLNHSFVNRGNKRISRVRAALDANNKVVLIISAENGKWNYPQITLEKLLSGFGTVVKDVEKGWTGQFILELPEGLTLMTEFPATTSETTTGAQSKATAAAKPANDRIKLWERTGTTYIDGGQIFTDSVTANQIAAGAITTSEIATGAVTANEIAANAITADKIAANAITIGSGTNFASGYDPTTKVTSAEATTIADAAATAAVKPANDRIALWEHTGTTYISGGQIFTDSITANQIAAGAITTSEIATNAVTANEIAAGTITATQIAGTTITGNKLVANTITAAQIAGKTVTAAQIAATTITGAEIASNAITAVKITGRTITADKIVASSITANEIAGNTITGAKIAGGTITGDKIVANTISADKLVFNSITGAHIATDAITTDEIAAGSITTDLIAASGISADVIKTGTLGANTIFAGTLQAAKGTFSGTVQVGDSYTASGVVTVSGAGVESDKITVVSSTAHYRNRVKMSAGVLEFIYDDQNYSLNGKISSTLEMRSSGLNFEGDVFYVNGVLVAMNRVTLGDLHVWSGLNVIAPMTVNAPGTYTGAQTFNGDASFKGTTYWHGSEYKYGYEYDYSSYEPVTNRNESGYCGIAGYPTAATYNSIGGYGVNFRKRRVYTPSSIGLSHRANYGGSVSYTDLTSDGFWLYLNGNGTTQYQYWRGFYYVY